MPALVKTPSPIAPWPPATPDKEEVKVLAGWSFETIVQTKNISLADLLKFNFEIDIATQKSWPYFVNWYLREKLRCTRLTAGGNFMFSGGETLYTPLQRAPKKPPIAAMTRDEIIDWFKTVMIPQRTASAGSSFNRIWKTPQRVFGGGADPNGICGAVADYVWDKGIVLNTGPYQIGYILWHVGPFTHVGNIIMPKIGVKVFNKDNDLSVATDATPRKYNNRGHDWHAVRGLTVIDLYYKEVSTVDDWWRAKSYAGWGELIIDPDGQFMNGVDD